MTFVKLDDLETALSPDMPAGTVHVLDCDGRKCELALEKKLLCSPTVGNGSHPTGLALARATYELGPAPTSPLADVTMAHLNHGQPLTGTKSLLVPEHLSVPQSSTTCDMTRHK